MKQGILITAYKDFGHLLDITSFFNSHFEIYIHIDKKSDITQDFIDTLKKDPKVRLVSRKFTVNWGGLNHLKSILHLAEVALKNRELERFHLISGHDYPIKSPSYFMEFFNNNRNKNYLSSFEFPLKQWPHGGHDRIDY